MIKNINARIALSFCLIAALTIGLYFHDKFWWGPDDGFYAYISQRMLEGDVVHKDIQALHPGLLYFIHTAFLSLTDGAVVSLRYPLIILSLIQTGIAFKLLEHKGILTALSASIAMIAFGFIQFINPTPNWYLVTLTIVLAAYLIKADLKANKTLVLIGVIVGAAFLIRQLTGVFLALAVTSILVLDNSEDSNQPRQYAGTALLALLAICLSIFVLNTANLAGLLLFGIFPPIILLVSAFKSNLGWASMTIIISCLVWGAFIPALPLIIYHLATGSFGGWMNETFIAPFSFFDVPLVDQSSYFALLYQTVTDVLSGNFGSILSLLFWLGLLTVNLVLSILVIRNISVRPSKSVVIGILVIFHSLVALIYEIPIYLMYTTGLVLVGLLASDVNRRAHKFLVGTTIFLSSVAFIQHAGQPLDRSYKDIAVGKRAPWASHKLPSTNIWTNESTSDFYDAIMNSVNACTLPSDKLFAYPLHPEIYFLTQRQAAFRFLNSTFGITPSTDTAPYLDTVRSTEQPALIIHNTQDKHNTEYSDRFFNEVSSLYEKRGKIGDLDVYQRRGHSLASSCEISGGVNDTN